MPPLSVLRLVVVATLLACARTGAPTPATGPAGGAPRAFSSLTPRDTIVEQTALDGCVRLHHLWKRQLAAVRRTAGRPASERTAALIADVYRPYTSFWEGYLGNETAFTRWVQEAFNLEGDTRHAIPIEADPAELIVEATRRVSQFSGRPACSDWYIVYGPGWTNLGGLGPLGMVVDFFGMPGRSRVNDLRGGVDDFRISLPHEVQHIVFGQAHSADPDNGTLLERIVGEGFATYFADVYWGTEVSPAQALGYTEDEWRWALANERELWAMAEPLLRSRERAVINRFSAARERVRPGAPGKIGYFLGYRIIDAYVSGRRADSWRELYDLPVARILQASGYPGSASKSR